MANYRVDSRGVVANLQKYKTSLPEGAVQAMYTALKAGVATAQALSPVDTGKLRDSIKYNAVNEGKAKVSGSISAYAENTVGKDYARYQEAGFTDKQGSWHEGKRFMLAGRVEAERVLNEEVRKQTARRLKE
jgi:hypothetical protein